MFGVYLSAVLYKPFPLSCIMFQLIKSCLNDIKFLKGFRKSKNKQILKVTALYVIWNQEICQDPPTCGQDDLVLCCAIAVLTAMLQTECRRSRLKIVQKVSLDKKFIKTYHCRLWWQDINRRCIGFSTASSGRHPSLGMRHGLAALAKTVPRILVY